jgi:hypothetical protein
MFHSGESSSEFHTLFFSELWGFCTLSIIWYSKNQRTCILKHNQFSSSGEGRDNIFLDASVWENYVIYPLFNGLSDHDEQFIVLREVKAFIKNGRARGKNDKEN